MCSSPEYAFRTPGATAGQLGRKSRPPILSHGRVRPGDPDGVGQPLQAVAAHDQRIEQPAAAQLDELVILLRHVAELSWPVH